MTYYLTKSKDGNVFPSSHTHFKKVKEFYIASVHYWLKK